MAEQFLSERNLKFLLHEVFDVTSLTKYSYYEEYDRKMLDQVLQAAFELARGLLWPHFQEMDRKPPELIGDEVKVHPSVKNILKEFGEGGWISMTVPDELDGQQLPQLIADSCQFVFTAANYSAADLSGALRRGRPPHRKFWKQGALQHFRSQYAWRPVAGDHGPYGAGSGKFSVGY